MYAGMSRPTREMKNCDSERPQLLMQMTKPLMTKKVSTPSQAYCRTAFAGAPKAASSPAQARSEDGMKW
jgi:hypothetical protein